MNFGHHQHTPSQSTVVTVPTNKLSPRQEAAVYRTDASMSSSTVVSLSPTTTHHHHTNTSKGGGNPAKGGGGGGGTLSKNGSARAAMGAAIAAMNRVTTAASALSSSTDGRSANVTPRRRHERGGDVLHTSKNNFVNNTGNQTMNYNKAPHHQNSERSKGRSVATTATATTNGRMSSNGVGADASTPKRDFTLQKKAKAWGQTSGCGGGADEDYDGGDGNAENEMKKTQRGAWCNLPLWLIFVVECLVVIAAFTAILVFSDVSTSESSTNLVESSIRNSLLFAASEIAKPITSAAQQMSEFRDRSLSYIATTIGQEMCNGSVHTFTNSAQFFSDSTVSLRSSYAVDSIFYVRRLRPPNYNSSIREDHFQQIYKSIVLCSTNRKSIFKSFTQETALDGVTDVTPFPIETQFLPTITDFLSLDGVPREARLSLEDYGDHEQNHVNVVLNTPRFAWTPHVQSMHGGARLRLIFIGSAPFLYNVTFVNGTRKAYYETQVGKYGGFRAGSGGVTRVDVLSAIGSVYTFDNLLDLLATITVADAKAHTTVYDLDNQLMLATSHAPSSGQFDTSALRLYAAGATPFGPVNRAFFASNLHNIGTGDTRVDMASDNDDDVIVSAHVFLLPLSGKRIGVVQATPRLYYFGDVEHLRTVTIGLGVSCAVIIVLICCWLLIVIYRGIDSLVDNMALAAEMKNDRTSYISSVISDIEKLGKGFGKMNRKLLEARAYLPQHLLVTSSDESGDDEDEGSLNENDDNSRVLSHHNRTETSNPSQSHDGGGGNRSRSSSNYRMSDGKRKEGKGGGGGGVGATHGGLTVKRVTILSINGRGFHSHVNALAPSTVGTPVASMTDTIQFIAQENRGVIDSFHGDHFVVSFNAARSNAEGPVKAARCALDISHVGTESGRLFAMGISSGRACVGNMGTSTLKRLSIIGPVYSKAMALERICKRFNHPSRNSANEFLPVQCLLDGKTASEVQHAYILQVLGGLYGPPFTAPPLIESLVAKADEPIFGMEAPIKDLSAGQSAPPIETYHCLRMPIVSQGGDEWLYEIQNNRATLLAELNAIVNIYLNKCFTTGDDSPSSSASIALRDGIKSIANSARKSARIADHHYATTTTPAVFTVHTTNDVLPVFHSSPLGVDAILDSDENENDEEGGRYTDRVTYLKKSQEDGGEGYVVTNYPPPQDGGLSFETNDTHNNNNSSNNNARIIQSNEVLGASVNESSFRLAELSARDGLDAAVLAVALDHALALADGRGSEDGDHYNMPYSKLPRAILGVC